MTVEDTITAYTDQLLEEVKKFLRQKSVRDFHWAEDPRRMATDELYEWAVGCPRDWGGECLRQRLHYTLAATIVSGVQRIPDELFDPQTWQRVHELVIIACQNAINRRKHSTAQALEPLSYLISNFSSPPTNARQVLLGLCTELDLAQAQSN